MPTGDSWRQDSLKVAVERSAWGATNEPVVRSDPIRRALCGRALLMQPCGCDRIEPAGEVPLDVDVPAMLSALADQRPVFHSERSFQHALAWQIRLPYPDAWIRLEPRLRRGIHLDMLVASANGAPPLS